MIYPEFLKEGGSIGFPAPSFGCATEPYYTAFTHMLEVMRDKGHLLYPGENAFVSVGVGISNTPAHCGGEFTSMWADSDIDALISCGGGELMCEILDYVDFNVIKSSKPKWFMGYSDNTNMTFLLATMCDIASIYGPCASTFGMEPWHPSLDDFYNLLKGKKISFSAYDKWEDVAFKDPEHPLAPINATEDRIHKLYFDGQFYDDARKAAVSFGFRGRMIGGCMDCLVNLLGTNYDHVTEFNAKYANDGVIWVLEACDLNVFAMRRAMWQMEHAGWFKNVRGFIIGRPANGDAIENLDRYQAILNVAAKYNVPVVMDADIGHRSPMIPVVMGAIGNVFVSANEMNISYEFV